MKVGNKDNRIDNSKLPKRPAQQKFYFFSITSQSLKPVGRKRFKQEKNKTFRFAQLQVTN